MCARGFCRPVAPDSLRPALAPSWFFVFSRAVREANPFEFSPFHSASPATMALPGNDRAHLDTAPMQHRGKRSAELRFGKVRRKSPVRADSEIGAPGAVSRCAQMTVGFKSLVDKNHPLAHNYG